MKDSKLEQIRKRRLAGFTAALLFTLGVVVVFTANAMPNPSSSGSGPWLNSAYSEDCGPGQICAEWPDGVSDTAMVCCIDEADLGTFNYNECETYITHRVIN